MSPAYWYKYLLYLPKWLRALMLGRITPLLPAHWLVAVYAGLPSAQWGHRQWAVNALSPPAWQSPHSGGKWDKLKMNSYHISSNILRCIKADYSSPPQAVGGWWMHSSAPSPPGGLCALPASPSPPSADTSRWHPAWRCPAGGASYPGLRRARVEVQRHRWGEREQSEGGGGTKEDESKGRERCFDRGECVQYREVGRATKWEIIRTLTMINCFCTRGQCTDKLYTQMVRVKGNETLNHVVAEMRR